jgi:hypothetical protein
MAPRPRPNIGWPRTVLVVGALVGGGIAVAGPAHAGADEFLNDINSVGIGNRDDPHNFDLGVWQRHLLAALHRRGTRPDRRFGVRQLSYR